MMNTAVDTLKIFERLKKADLTEKAAKEIAETFKETIEDQLITKVYLDQRLAELKTEIIKWVAGMLVAQAAIVATLVKLL
ncbi:MAG: DUF1640 domain-containing protein [Elusimicrobiota bacterium]